MAKKYQNYKNIISFETQDGSILGFHSHNFDIAELDQEAWSALSEPNPSSSTLNEFDMWNDEVSTDIVHLKHEQNVYAFSINVSQVCNLKCEYCGAGGDGTYGSNKAKIDLEPTLHQIRHYMSQLDQGEEFHIRFFGGEPLLYPSQIKKMAQFAQTMAQEFQIRLDMVVVTNGTLITEKVAQFLAHYNFNVTISLDSTPEINDVVRPLKGIGSSSVLTLKGVELLLKYRDQLKLLKFSSVFGDHNNDIIKTYKFLSQFNFDLYSFNSAASKEEHSNQNYLSALEALAQYIFEKEGIQKLFHITPLREYLLRIDQKKHIENHCGAGKTYIHTDTRNKLYSCNWLMTDKKEMIGENIRFDAEIMKHYKPSFIETHNCHCCWAKHLCGGGCLFYNKMKNNNKHEKDLAFCTKTKGIILIALEYYAKAQLKGA